MITSFATLSPVYALPYFLPLMKTDGAPGEVALKDIIIHKNVRRPASPNTALQGPRHPTPCACQIMERGRPGILNDNSWGPAVPYSAIDHQGGMKNHGYMRTKRDDARYQELAERL